MAALVSQIEDLSQQAHKAAAEKFKVPVTSSPLAPPAPPSLTIKEESEDEVEEVLAGDAVTLPRPVKCLRHCKLPSLSHQGGRRRPGAEGHRAGDGSGQRVARQGRPCAETQQERHCERNHGEEEGVGVGVGVGSPEGRKRADVEQD